MISLLNSLSILSPTVFAATSNAVASDAAANAAQAQVKSAGQFQVMMIVLMFAVMYFLVFRPQKKKEKEAERLRSNIDIGDEIVTIGGIIGTVVSLKEDFIVIETSGDRNKLRIQRWAIHTNNTVEEKERKEAESKKTNKNLNKQKI